MPELLKTSSYAVSPASSPVNMQSAASPALLTMSSPRHFLCLPENDHVQPLSSPTRSRSPRSGGMRFCNGKRLVRKDTGISDHCDVARRQSDHDEAIKKQMQSLQLTSAVGEEVDEEEDDEGVSSETASMGSGCESSSVSEPGDCQLQQQHQHLEPAHQKMPADSKLSTSSSGFDSAESAEDEEVEVLPALPQPRGSRTGPYRFKRRDTGLRDHEQKGRRRSSDALDTKARLQVTSKSSDLLEEEEEEA